MSLVSLENISVSFGPNDILTSISCEANQGDRIGLVGRNGSGKTTLLHVLAGLLPPTLGRRHIARPTRAALVEQLPPTINPATIVHEEVLAGIDEVLRLERELEMAAEGLADGGVADTEYGDLLNRFEAAGGFTYESRLAQILNGLGLEENEWNKPLGALSGGQRSRVALAKALLAEPDLLLMDEPTNHLDLPGLQWLETFLRRWQGTVIVSSHDRYFLDSVVTSVWHLEGRRLRSYPGNYTKFEGLLEAEAGRQRKQHEAQQEFIEKEEAFIRRYRAGSRAREARGRAKRLARMERIEAPGRAQTTRLSLSARRSAEVVLSAQKLNAGYNGRMVLDVGDLELIRSARVALIGPNGSGKTTLLKTIAGELLPTEGRVRLGESVRVAHYWQEAENLNDGSTVLEELLASGTIAFQQARDLLGRFLFSGDDVNKLVGMLSGGERGRLALAKLVVSGANFLLLDEPTNHLDIPSRQALEEALASYSGTFIFASHDRRLISRLATELWLIEDKKLRSFKGSLEEYNRLLDQAPSRDEEGSGARRPQGSPAPQRASQPSAWQRRRALDALEDEIERQEQALARVTEELDLASRRGDTNAISELGTRFAEVQAGLESLLTEWSELAGNHSNVTDERAGA